MKAKPIIFTTAFLWIVVLSFPPMVSERGSFTDHYHLLLWNVQSYGSYTSSNSRIDWPILGILLALAALLSLMLSPFLPWLAGAGRPLRACILALEIPVLVAAAICFALCFAFDESAHRETEQRQIAEHRASVSEEAQRVQAESAQLRENVLAVENRQLRDYIHAKKIPTTAASVAGPSKPGPFDDIIADLLPAPVVKKALPVK